MNICIYKRDLMETVVFFEELIWVNKCAGELYIITAYYISG